MTLFVSLLKHQDLIVFQFTSFPLSYYMLEKILNILKSKVNSISNYIVFCLMTRRKQKKRRKNRVLSWQPKTDQKDPHFPSSF